MRRTALLPAFLSFLLIGQGLLLARELCLTYDVTTRQAFEKKNGEPEEKEARSKVTVALGNGYFYISDASGKIAYDFQKHRIIYVDEPTKTYSDVSLFFNIGFRALEFQNRLYINEVLKKAAERSKKKQPPRESVFDIESIFSIEKPGSPAAQVTEARQGERYIYGFDQKPIAECLFSGEVLSPAQKALLDKYLVYGCRMHPQVRRKIIAQGKVPKYLKGAYHDGGDTVTVEMTLTKAATEPRDTYLIPPDYQKTYGPPGEELTAIITSVREGTNPVKRLQVKDFERIADELIAKGSYFDAVLAAVECNLQTGEDLLARKMKEIAAQNGMTDERIAVFFQNTNIKDRASAKKAIDKLGSIKRKGLTHGYVIDIMIADDKMTARDLDGAKELFLKVLRANPYITGVYKDLGNLMYGSYNTVTAWQCWDTARFLCLNHPLLSQVDEYEKGLEKNFPDFFLPKKP